MRSQCPSVSLGTRPCRPASEYLWPSGMLCQMAGWLVCSFLHSAAVSQGRPTCQLPFFHPRHIRIPGTQPGNRSSITDPEARVLTEVSPGFPGCQAELALVCCGEGGSGPQLQMISCRPLGQGGQRASPAPALSVGRSLSLLFLPAPLKPSLGLGRFMPRREQRHGSLWHIKLTDGHPYQSPCWVPPCCFSWLESDR